jgi:hypothetical protein
VVRVHALINRQKADAAAGLIRRSRWASPLAFVVTQGALLTTFLSFP